MANILAWIRHQNPNLYTLVYWAFANKFLDTLAKKYHKPGQIQKLADSLEGIALPKPCTLEIFELWFTLHPDYRTKKTLWILDGFSDTAQGMVALAKYVEKLRKDNASLPATLFLPADESARNKTLEAKHGAGH
jgi:hypothetical protein